jgi:hypothetical protein
MARIIAAFAAYARTRFRSLHGIRPTQQIGAAGDGVELPL